MRIIIDVDETLAQMHAPWLARYRAASGHQLMYFDQWDMKGQVLLGWEEKIFGLLTPDLYDEVKPYPGASEFTSRLCAAGYDIVFVSDCRGDFRMRDRKRRWLVEAGLMCNRESFLPDVDRSALGGDVLVDDRLSNLIGFGLGGGRLGVLMSRPHNFACRAVLRCRTFAQAAELIGDAERGMRRAG